MNELLIKRIRECPTLPSLPAIALQVLELAQKEQVDIAEIARIISKDPALSSKILRTVNSSFYGRSQSISTISHALVILGLQSVKTLVLGFSLVTHLAKAKGKGFKHINYWRRSIYAATAARTLASRLGLVQQEECFLAALLMDIGMLVLDQLLGEEYGDIYERATSHDGLPVLEQQGLQLTHADVAGVLASQWKLPPVLATPISYHHQPEKVQDGSLRKLAEVTQLAGRCADVFVDDKPAGAIADVRKAAATHGIAETDCDAMLDEICTRTREIAPLFEISLSTATNFENILKRANEALVDLTLRTQQQAVSLQEQAETLQQRNQQLQVQATTDGLTGLANRARFDEFMADHFAKAVKNAKPISIVLLDVDRFKSVNDRYGHPTGDQVLRLLGAIVRSAARSQDLAARYGGEEMVLVLPGATRQTAAAIAESIRRMIAAKPLDCTNGLRLPITASMGVASYEPPSPLTLPAHLVKAADLALYAAKSGGRNCVRVFALKAPAKVA